MSDTEMNESRCSVFDDTSVSRIGSVGSVGLKNSAGGEDVWTSTVGPGSVATATLAIAALVAKF